MTYTDTSLVYAETEWSELEQALIDGAISYSNEDGTIFATDPITDPLLRERIEQYQGYCLHCDYAPRVYSGQDYALARTDLERVIRARRQELTDLELRLRAFTPPSNGNEPR